MGVSVKKAATPLFRCFLAKLFFLQCLAFLQFQLLVARLNYAIAILATEVQQYSAIQLFNNIGQYEE